MTKRMLIDATHAEETRVVVLDGNRLEDFDVETSTKKQIKGNIYLAKVVRVEPSLQAAFVEYGGGRHGFLSFDEIHPDYYQIPVADRQRLLAMEAEDARREQEEEDRAAAGEAGGHRHDRAPKPELDDSPAPPTPDSPHDLTPLDLAPYDLAPDAGAIPPAPDAPAPFAEAPSADAPATEAQSAAIAAEPATAVSVPSADSHPFEDAGADDPHPGDAAPTPRAQPMAIAQEIRHGEVPAEDAPEPFVFDDAPADEAPPEIIGGEHDTSDESSVRRTRSRALRSYKIQEVIHRRQILLVQVEKEERGTKGAALTTYISLAGRYSVLMPNSPRGGGISRKITAPADRRRLKEVMAELDLPDGMGLIVRTAGANRPKPEIKRDAEYLLRLWDDVRERTLQSVAPALIHEEASLIKRAIRDVYSRDIDEIAVDGEDAWRAARDFMRMLMPTQARKVQLWRDPSAPPGTAGQPLFARHGVDAQLDAMLSPNVQLRSGGYLVINQAEALVAIDVNSGRSTRERGIEETALRTNLEAAEEVARQLRLRDLAGLIVIDFIDMEVRRNNAQVEKRLKDALKVDRARIQLGHISHFGLLEMSRQRLRPSLAETSLVTCAHCGGSGHVRSTESAAIHVLRAIEEEGAKHRAGEILVRAALPIVLYILNHKRERLAEIERRHGLVVAFGRDDALIPPQIQIEKLKPWVAPEHPAALAVAAPVEDAEPFDAGEDDADEPADETAIVEARPESHAESGAESRPGRNAPAAGEDTEANRRRRRRRRRGGRREDGTTAPADTDATEAPQDTAAPGEAASLSAAESTLESALEGELPMEGVPEHAEPATGEQAARRRGRRGGRRRRREDDPLPEVAAPGAEQPDLPEVYIGPTPANPFGGQVFDIFDVIEQAEARALEVEARPALVTPKPPASTESAPVAHAAVEPAPATIVATPAAPTETAPLENVPVAVAPVAVAPVAVVPVAVAPEPAAPAADVANGPAIQPIVVGGEPTPPAERRQGWWRRPA